MVPADHYKCYKTLGARNDTRTVTLADQFGTEQVTVKRPFRLCNPANKNGEGVIDSTSHLMCYKIRPHPFVQRTVLAQNQFGDNYLRIIRPESLCNPAAKNFMLRSISHTLFPCRCSRTGLSHSIMVPSRSISPMPRSRVSASMKSLSSWSGLISSSQSSSFFQTVNRPSVFVASLVALAKVGLSSSS